jgi:hypothetical protein
MIAITLIAIGVTAILLAMQTPLVTTGAGRSLVVVAVVLMVVTSPLADGMPVVDRLIAATIGGYALHCIISATLGPVPYRVLRQPPRALLAASRSAYTMRFQVATV